MEVDKTGEEMTGTVKWFDPGKGFGFVVRDGGGPDVLLHSNVLRNYGQASISEGSAVRMTVVSTPRGDQAERILSITPPASSGGAPLDDLEHLTDAERAQMPLLPARVKWFDKAKGFGFANVFGARDDIFVHVEVVRRCGLAELTAGEAIAIRVMQGERGRMAVEIKSWDLGEDI
ncbi:cold shock domain-containing protein [Loktanella sp. TSTF-M6]|uniref:Cold shock domain-containing protein n=1 Tax=Loktanella gaetbuli TaxID=2881335 RepID=A0ABS8BRA3_9RHOB|nr:cold shock domain-containing protein [Loktanella gaetbuli]MCB5198236.1 cold shock domain-containing protein [Loktanella gaetbuli]